MIQESGNAEIDSLKRSISVLTRAIQDKDEKIKQLQKEMNSREISTTPIQTTYTSTNDTNKHIVKLYAQGYSAGFIFNILNREMNINSPMTEIENLIRSIEGDSLLVDNELLAYYVECKKIFEDEQSLTKGLFSQTIYKKLKIMEATYSKILVMAEENGDFKEMRMTTDSIVRLDIEMAKIFSKQVLDLFNNGKTNGATYAEDYKKLKDQYIEEATENDKKVIKFKRGS